MKILLSRGGKPKHAKELVRVFQTQFDPKKLRGIEPLERGFFLFFR